MNVRYELRSVGVFDRDLAAVIVQTDPRWTQYHAWLAAGNCPDPEPVEPRDLDEVIEEKIAAIEDMATQTRRRITGRASPQEMASWAVKLEQAHAFFRGEQAYPMLIAEAAARGVTIDEIASRIQKNAVDFSMAEAHIAGVSGRHKDAVRAAKSIEHLLAYDVSTGWSLVPAQKPQTAPAPVIAPIDPVSL